MCTAAAHRSRFRSIDRRSAHGFFSSRIALLSIQKFLQKSTGSAGLLRQRVWPIFRFTKRKLPSTSPPLEQEPATENTVGACFSPALSTPKSSMVRRAWLAPLLVTTGRRGGKAMTGEDARKGAKLGAAQNRHRQWRKISRRRLPRDQQTATTTQFPPAPHAQYCCAQRTARDR